MKIVFDVEKRDETTGKIYYPGIEYEMSEEKAKAILKQTKYAHEVKNAPKNEKIVPKDNKKSKKSSNNEQDNK